MDNDKIEVGDIIRVNLNSVGITLCREAMVISTPCVPGDSWIIKDINTNELHYISETCTITLIKKA